MNNNSTFNGGTDRPKSRDAHRTPPTPRQRRALPGWAIDLIRDGVPTQELRVRGQRAVWNALGRTALAAVNAGHSRPEWEYEVMRPVSKLGLQNRLRADGKERTAQAANKALNSAWDRAAKHATESPAWTRETARQEAEERAAALRLVVANPDNTLTNPQREILNYAANMAARQGSVSVNLPRAATARAIGLGEKSVRFNLVRLSDQGLLKWIERGRPRTKNDSGRSNVYRLYDSATLQIAITSLSRETRQVGPVPETGGPQDAVATGPTQVVGAHLSPEGRSLRSRTGGARSPTVGEIRAQARRGLETLIARAMTRPEAAVAESTHTHQLTASRNLSHTSP